MAKPLSRSLPPELWLSIASFLSKSSLVGLSLASFTLSTLIRLHLFHCVILVTGDARRPNAPETLNLLAHDQSLAASVVELRLDRYYPQRLGGLLSDFEPPPPLAPAQINVINSSTLANLTSMKHPTIAVCIWWNDDQLFNLEHVQWLETLSTLRSSHAIVPQFHLGRYAILIEFLLERIYVQYGVSSSDRGQRSTPVPPWILVKQNHMPPALQHPLPLPPLPYPRP
jgi:hypothetical protein